jgi:hypothetical protein
VTVRKPLVDARLGKLRDEDLVCGARRERTPAQRQRPALARAEARTPGRAGPASPNRS